MIRSKNLIFSLSIACVFFSSLNLAYAMDKWESAKETEGQNTRKKPRLDTEELHIETKDLPSEPVTKFVKEAFLSDDIKKLKSENKKTVSTILHKEVNLYSCDELAFEQLFPVCVVGNSDYKTDKSFFAGQIRNSTNDEGIGTGTLVNIEMTDDKIRITGITALHNFVAVSKLEDLKVSAKFSKKFSLGSKAHPTEKEDIFSLGNAKIDKIMVPKAPTKDICLFEGEFIFTAGLFDSDKDCFEKLSKHVPNIIEKKITEEEGCESFMYHYPLGKKDQRKNEGIALKTGKHKIGSLFGSSGASLFNKNAEIFGIHTGASYNDLCNDGIAEYDEEKDIPIANFNLFEIINLQDYNELKEGVDLLGSTGNFNEEFYNSLCKLVENISK